MEDKKEAVQGAQGGGGATAASDEQENQIADGKEFHQLKDVDVDGATEQKDEEISVQSSIANPEHSSSQVISVEPGNPPSVGANAEKLCLESVGAEDDKCEQKLNDEVPEVMSSAENGSREEELGNNSRDLGNVQKEDETEGRVKEVEVVGKSPREEANGVIVETAALPETEMKELKNEPDVKTSSRCFLLDPNDGIGDESGSEEEQAAFMKELETFHRERCLDFKPPKFYQEPLNCLKLWRAVIRLGGYEQVTSLKLWRQVGESFRPPKTCTTVSWTFRGFYEKALLEYEKFKMRCGELPFTDSSLSDPASGNQVELIHASGSGRARRDAAARAMQGWHSQRLLGNGEVGDPIIKDKNPITTPKREKQLRNIGFLKRKGSPVEHAVRVARVASKSQFDIMVVDVGVPADWVKVNVQKMKDCYEVYALVPGLLREEVRVQSDPAGRLVISGQPEQQDNPWGVTPFKKVVSLPTRIDPHHIAYSVRKGEKGRARKGGRCMLGEMPPARILVAAAALLWAVAVGVVVGGEGKSLMLTLERVSHEGVGMSQLRTRDRVRHGRILQQQPLGVVDFHVEGTYDPFLVGLYFTKVKLGTPPKEFYVQIDTGSDVLWVSCNPCNGCPTSSGLQIELEFFDISSSSTASPISCSDQRCALGEQSSDSGCSGQDQCGYTFQYGDGSGTSGYYVYDSMFFDSIVGDSMTSNNSAPVVFGCSTSQSGDLTKPDRAVDGIFGFGQQGLSVISQLSSQGITPNAFSHCLKGDNNGGGILVLGQIVEPNMVYTPLVPSQPHYNVNLQSIAVNGQTINIDSSVFATSNNRGTIIDSGTTLAYLAEEAYDPFVTAITQIASESVRPVLSKGNQCYLTTSSVSEIFPPVTLNFAGGASMTLRPQDYLLQQNSIAGAAVWCIGIQKIQGQGITILGDLVLKDKIVVYDLGGQRIGWVNYDCSSSVNVSSTSSTGKTEFFNAGQVDNNAASYNVFRLIPSTIIPLFLFHIAFFGILPFL